MSSLPFSLQRFSMFMAQNVNVRARTLLMRKLVAMLGCNDLPNRADFARLRPALRWAINGLVSSVALILTITVAAIASTAMSTTTLDVFGMRTSVTSGADARAHKTFDSILQRPLFSRQRQAAVVISAPPPPLVPRAQNLVLKGVFINGASSKAFLTSERDPLGTWVENNEEISGWRVVSIKPDAIMLRAPNDERVIALGNPTSSQTASETLPLLQPPRGMALPKGGLNRGILVQPGLGPQNTKAAAPGMPR
jgi:hypothetical protein